MTDTLLEKSVVYILPSKGGSGGTFSIVDEIRALRDYAVDAWIAIPLEFQASFLNYHPDAEGLIITLSGSTDTTVSISKKIDIAVATNWRSVSYLATLLKDNTEIIPMYYIQDYEPWFFVSSDKGVDQAMQSYSLVPEAVCFAKSDWLVNLLREKHQLNVHKVTGFVGGSAAKTPFELIKKETQPVHIVALVRPSTARRAPERTLKVLGTIKRRFGNSVRITVFGCTDDALGKLNVPTIPELHNAGELTRDGVNQLLQTMDIFVDCSDYQAFGRIGLEAMTAGCATILPRNGGSNEYATHGLSALFVDTANITAIIDTLETLIADHNLRNTIITAGLAQAKLMTVANAVQSRKHLFEQAIQKKGRPSKAA